ncbi:hypothetical protein BT93_I1773 [Corymbia citriodora subsp. variegata]|nr:hypothetical protein BT93_I1773 [Corymbia citriodora subsp. variegata]
MAKSCGEEGKRREGKKNAAFSETELDAARQLMQLSGNSDESDGGARKEKVEDDGAEASSAFRDVALSFGENEDDDLMRRHKRYRSIQHIYRSTKPIIDAMM